MTWATKTAGCTSPCTGLRGQDLKRLLEQSGALSPDRAVAIALQMASAIDTMHIAGLIHRDIKPGNVVIRTTGATDHAYLTDFGVAKPAFSNDQLTQTGWMVGTAGYVSPEQIRGEQPGPRSDLYALGCLLYETLTGTPPFHGENEVALLWAHANDPRPVASEVAPQLGDRYDAFFATALALYPSERFYSGREFASALTVAHGAPGVAGRPRPQQRVRTRPRRRARTRPRQSIRRPRCPRRSHRRLLSAFRCRLPSACIQPMDTSLRLLRTPRPIRQPSGPDLARSGRARGDRGGRARSNGVFSRSTPPVTTPRTVTAAAPTPGQRDVGLGSGAQQRAAAAVVGERRPGDHVMRWRRLRWGQHVVRVCGERRAGV